MSTKPTHTADPIIQRFRSLAKESPDLKDAAQLYEAIHPLLRDADLHVGTISLTPEQVRAKMNAGLPLLHDVDIDLDVEAVRELMIKLARAVETASKKNSWHKLRLPWLQTSSEPGAAARRIRLALEENRLDISALLPHIASGESGPITSAAQNTNHDPGLLMTLAQNALKPALRARCRQLAPLARGISWDKSDCFMCGAAATLAELQENDQVKHLRCGSCGADWPARRLQCVYCGNEDHRTLPRFFEEKEFERIQLEACDKCKGYLKVIASFRPAHVEMLAVEDLATLHLDYIAKARGYTRGVQSSKQIPDR
jgi:FdhE protein